MGFVDAPLENEIDFRFNFNVDASIEKEKENDFHFNKVECSSPKDVLCKVSFNWLSNLG